MSWDDEAATWDTQPAVRAYSKAAFQSLQRVLMERGSNLTGARVLDFGCGTGLLTEQLAAEAERVMAVDVAQAMVAVLREKNIGNVEPVCGLLNELIESGSLSMGAFDLITCSSVCSFLGDYPAAVAQLAALLAPDGLLLQWDWELEDGADDAMGLSRSAITAALSAAGLTDLSVGVGFTETVEGFVMAPLLGVGRKP